MTLTTFDKIKERKIVQWALTYLAGAWLVLQVVDVLGGMYGWPDSLVRSIPVMLVAGFLATLVLAWYHGEKGAQRISGVELSILATLLAIAGLGVMLVGGGHSAQVPSIGSSGDADQKEILDRASVAVLPFDNLSREDAEGYFASGLTEELLATMARVPGLKVAARTSSFAFRDSSDSTQAIGQALGVAHLVEGSVRRAGDQVRVTARLVDADSGSEMWTNTYERRLEDVFAVQEQIARAVARELRIRVGEAALARAGTESIRAYDELLRGRAILERREGTTAEWIAAAETAFEAAIEVDENYASAWGGLSRLRLQKAYRGIADDPEAMYDAARDAAKRALSLAPQQGDALYTLGLIALHHDRDYQRAADEFQSAIDANPSDARSLALIGWALHPLGQKSRAVRLAERALELDPLSLTVLNNASSVLVLDGQVERATAILQAALELEPESPVLSSNLGAYLSLLGRHEEAIERADRSVALAPESEGFRSMKTWVYARAGRIDQPDEALASIPEDDPAMRGNVAWALGKQARAFEYFERAIRAGELSLADLESDPFLDTVRDSRGWSDLIELARVLADEQL